MTLKDCIPAQIKDTAHTVVLPEAAELARLMPARPDASRLTVTCRPGDYSASAIARAVEDCNAHLLNLNVTSDTDADGDLTVELRISHRDTGAVARSRSATATPWHRVAPTCRTPNFRSCASVSTN